MAPEILENKPYGKSVDIWSLGVFLYELLQGHSPFVGNNVIKIYKKIMKNHIRFKRDINPLAVDLILRLLKNDPRKRLTIDQILRSPFMLEVKNKIYQKNQIRMKPKNTVTTVKKPLNLGAYKSNKKRTKKLALSLDFKGDVYKNYRKYSRLGIGEEYLFTKK